MGAALQSLNQTLGLLTGLLSVSLKSTFIELDEDECVLGQSSPGTQRHVVHHGCHSEGEMDQQLNSLRARRTANANAKRRVGVVVSECLQEPVTMLRTANIPANVVQTSFGGSFPRYLSCPLIQPD